MTLYLARPVVDGAVDETTTVYLGRCDVIDCRYLADHGSSEVVEDALDGHRRRAHATATARTEDTTRTGWLTFTGPIAAEAVHEDGPAKWAQGAPTWAGALSDHDASGGRPTDPPAAPGWSAANDPHLPPSPTPREEQS